jgi:hypothetical protein
LTELQVTWLSSESFYVDCSNLAKAEDLKQKECPKMPKSHQVEFFLDHKTQEQQ